ncbi:MAG TPA: CopD family protein [Steroidobacteraceae bacterium]
MPDVVSIVLRAASFVLQLQAAGTAIFLALFAHRLTAIRPAVRRLGGMCALAGIVLVACHQFLEGARMAGAWAGVFDPAMQRIALQSSAGAAFALRMLGLALIAAALLITTARRVPMWAAASLLGAGLCVAAFLATGHTSTRPDRPVLAMLLGVHVVVAAFWIGSLWPLHLASEREPRASAAGLIGAFSSLALRIVPAIFLAGVALALLLVPGLAVFSQPYGRLLLCKAALFGVLLLLAALNKWKFARQVGGADLRAAGSADGVGGADEAGRAAAGGVAFRRTVVAEYVLICIVLAVTAVMTGFYSPEGA